MAKASVMMPAVVTLSQLQAGQAARVVRVLPGPRQVRLVSLGVVAGARIELRQHSPAIVVRLGATTLALEPEIGVEILVEVVEEVAFHRTTSPAGKVGANREPLRKLLRVSKS